MRIWVEDADSLPADVTRAIGIWRDGFLYGEYDASIVSDSATADVIVTLGVAPGPQLSAHPAPERAGAAMCGRHRCQT